MYNGIADNMIMVINSINKQLDTLKSTVKYFKTLEKDIRNCRGAATQGARNGNSRSARGVSRNSQNATRRNPNNRTNTNRNSNTEEVVVQLVNWYHNFGNGTKAYKRLDWEGAAYIYDYHTRQYLGAYDESRNRLRTMIADPLRWAV